MLAVALALPPALRAQDIGLPIGTRAPAVVVADLDGKSVDLGSYVGKQPVLLEFWATWCPLFDAGGAAVRAYQAPTTSYVVVLDKAGKVTYTGAGAEQDVATALAHVVGN